MVLQKYPSPDAAVNAVVLTVVCQDTVPTPDNFTPEGKLTVSPEAPIVIVLAFSLIMLLPS